MNPTQSDLHVNVPLTVMSIAFMQSSDEFVADKVFPVIPVEKQSDVFYTYDRADFNRNQMKVRAPGAESAGGAYRVSNTPYFCLPYGLHKDIPEQVRANADAMFNLDNDAMEFLSTQALINREVTWASGYFGTGIWTTDITGVAAAPGAGQVLQWNDGASTPIEDIRAGKVVVKQSTGFRPNTLVLGEEVWNALVDHPDIVDRIKGAASPSSPAVVLRQAVAALLELERILVMGAIQNTAAEGLTAVHAFIGGKKALLCYAAPNPGLMTPSAGYTFAWRGYLGGTSPVRIKRFPMDALESDRIEIAAAYTQQKTAADLGYFFTTIVA